jgi:hypothetical protein
MRQPMMLMALSALGACASPLPPVDPKQAWVDLYTITPGRVIMADKLDGKRLEDGRYFQVTPGKHELVVRFDYEIYGGGMMSQPRDRTCYLTVRFDDFKAGERYRLEARAPVMEPQVLLHDANRTVVVNEPSNVFCIP